jgi:hypothetical protein
MVCCGNNFSFSKNILVFYKITCNYNFTFTTSARAATMRGCLLLGAVLTTEERLHMPLLRVYTPCICHMWLRQLSHPKVASLSTEGTVYWIILSKGLCWFYHNLKNNQPSNPPDVKLNCIVTTWLINLIDLSLLFKCIIAWFITHLYKVYHQLESTSSWPGLE